MTAPGHVALEFRDVARGRALQAQLERSLAESGRPITLMHVCGSHEQAIARYGLRARFPANLRVQMGPGCPVCVTDAPEIDACVALAERGVRVLTYGDMLRVPGAVSSLADARSRGARVDVIYSPIQAADIARTSPEPVVFFATGFETTAVATAALGTAQVLRAVDIAGGGGTTGPPVLGASLELDLGAGELLHRPWPPHPDCTCGAPPPHGRASRPPDGGQS